VIKRFQIEDLIIQDSSGVVFRALDTETGKTVAVRRFFPFGVDGGGLQAEQKTAYEIAVGRLAGISHPALRSVICGGCDPVDDMPFIATEWVEGQSLVSVLEQGPLTTELAIELITNALEVCELLSHVLAEEAVWVETDLQTIVIGDAESGRRFTLGISPLKWLGTGDASRGLTSIVTLTEEIMGWKGLSVNDQAGRGLGAWLNWLRGAAATTSLHEARESLAASIGAPPPAPAKKLVTRAAVPIRKPIKRSKPKALLVINILLGLCVAGLGGWVWIRKHPEHRLAKILQLNRNASPETMPEAGQPANADSIAAEPAALPDMGEPSLNFAPRIDQAKQSTLDAQKAAAEQNGGVIQWNHNELLISKHDTEVVVGGVFEKIDFSREKKTMYIMFSQSHGTNQTRGTILLKNAPDLTEAVLKPLIGKRIRIHGVVKVQKGKMRPEITIKNRSAIEVLD
jgi:hypothetical protein